MQDYSRVEISSLEHFDLAVVRVDRGGVVTYLNGAARTLLGCPPGMQVDLGLLFPEPEEYERAVTNLQRRMQGESSTYETRVWPPCAPAPREPVPVRVHAFPNTDADGQPIGAIALVDDLREDKVRLAINRALASSSERDQLLSTAAAEVRTIVPFDEFHVTMISKSRTRMRELYAKHEKRAWRELVRWWTMPDFIRDNLPRRVPELTRVDEMRADPDYARLAEDDPDTAAFFGLGVREFLSIPVWHENLVVAFVALYSYRDGVYTREHLEQLLRLPLAEVVMAALNRDQGLRQKVVVDLIQEMGERAVDLRKVADKMVDNLLDHFEWEEWEYTAVFQHDRQTGNMTLLCQARRDGRALPPQFSIPCTPEAAGASGEPGCPVVIAALTGEAVNRPTDRLGSPRAGIPGFTPRGAQLALPILGNGTRWVLYIESRVMNAFAEEELRPLTTLTARAGAILAHSALFEVQTAALQSIGDAVIEATPDGHIRWCNEAARRLFGIRIDGSAGTRLLDLAADATAAAALADQANFYHREVNLKRTGTLPPLTVLLSASTPEHFGGRVYVATDFEYQKELQRLDELKEVFRQAALEGRVPLALANAWLAERARQEPAWREDIEKIVRQIARADLPLERLLRLSSPPVASGVPASCDLARALSTTLAEMPASALDDIEVERTSDLLPVRGDFNDIQFCIESLISFGMRTRPPARKLRIGLRRAPPYAALRVEGDWVPESSQGVPLEQVERWRRKTLFDLTLSDSVIRHIVERAGGAYTCALGDRLLLEIALPLHAAGGAAP
jgi:PAS domain-containing protein